MEARRVIVDVDQELGNDSKQVDVLNSAQEVGLANSIFDLPADVRNYCLYPLLSKNELGLFARTCRKAESQTALTRLLPRLLHSAAHALPESYQQSDETKLAAIAILRRYPELLFIPGEVKDAAGRLVRGSAYRVFLGAADVWALKQIHESIIPQIENGQALAEADFRAQFPNCPWPPTQDMSEEALYDDRNRAQIAAVKAKLQVIKKKIETDPFTNGEVTLEETKQAVAALCQTFTPKVGEVIWTGLHFPLGIMQEILKVHDAQLSPWNVNQLAYFSRSVIGAAESASTAVDGQCYKHGLANLEAKGPDRRDGLICRHPKGIPFERSPLAGKLGNTVFVDPFDGGSCFLSSRPGYFDWYSKNAGVVSGGGVWGYASGMVSILMENKCRSFWELLSCNTPRSQHTVSLSMTARGNA